jgi:hypothetical protein
MPTFISVIKKKKDKQTCHRLNLKNSLFIVILIIWLKSVFCQGVAVKEGRELFARGPEKTLFLV